MKNQKNKINASSMADIAFLLLIFFLVTTTIDQDKGLLNKLPPLNIETSKPVHKRNVLEILINAEDDLMVNGKPLNVEELKALTKKHIKNNGVLPNFSENPAKAIISLQNDRGTSYDTYLKVQNELKAAYAEIRNAEALMITKEEFDYKALKTCIDLKQEKFRYCLKIKNQIKDKYPMIISEAEPFSAN